jgi:hypothetical protein
MFDHLLVGEAQDGDARDRVDVAQNMPRCRSALDARTTRTANTRR